MLTRRKFLVQSASSLALVLGASRLAKAAVGAWAQQQGGSQDLQTGLVWLDSTLSTGNIASYPQAISRSAAFDNGFNDWRLPTVSEMTTACSDGISLNCPLSGAPGGTNLWWSSETAKGGNYAYAVDVRTGYTQLVLIQSKLGKQVTYSQLYAMFVRQGTL